MRSLDERATSGAALEFPGYRFALPGYDLSGSWQLSVPVIASAAKQSIVRHNGWMDCFVASLLAMTMAAAGATNWHDGQNFSLPETQITGTS